MRAPPLPPPALHGAPPPPASRPPLPMHGGPPSPLPVLTGAARADRRSSCCRAAFVSSCAMIIYNRGDHRLEKGLQHVGIWAIACCGSCLRSSAERPDGESGASDGIPNRCKHQKVGSGSSSRRADPDTRAAQKSWASLALLVRLQATSVHVCKQKRVRTRTRAHLLQIERRGIAAGVTRMASALRAGAHPICRERRASWLPKACLVRECRC